MTLPELGGLLALAGCLVITSHLWSRRAPRSDLPTDRAWWLYLRLPGEARPREHPLKRLPVVVGRDGGADVPIELATLSRQHARLEGRCGRFFVRDLGSANGTWVRGRRLRGGAVEIVPGEEVVLAGEVGLTLVAAAGAAADGSEPWATVRLG